MPRTCFLDALPLLLPLAACGGNVVVDGSATSTTTTATAVTTADCAALLQDLQAKNATAQTCDPYYNPPIQCTGSATIKDTCGCTLPANAQDSAAVSAAAQAYAAWTSACGGPTLCHGCPPSSGAPHCQSGPNQCVP